MEILWWRSENLFAHLQRIAMYDEIFNLHPTRLYVHQQIPRRLLAKRSHL